FFAVYGCIAVFVAIFSGNPVYAPIFAISTAGFVYISYLSISHSSFRRKSKAKTDKGSRLAAADADAAGPNAGMTSSARLPYSDQARIDFAEGRLASRHRSGSAGQRLILPGI